LPAVKSSHRTNRVRERRLSFSQQLSVMAQVFGGASLHGRIPAEVAALAEKLRGMGVADIELNDMDVAGVYVTPEVDMMMPRTSSAIKVKTLTGKEIKQIDLGNTF
jgi:hypothetical protein